MQTRTGSLIEASINIGSGFLISIVVWQTIGPLFGYEVTLLDNLGITCVFTVVSIVRSYVWRRIFTTRIKRWTTVRS